MPGHAPMGFEGGDFVRGAFAACAVFVILLSAPAAIATLVSGATSE